MPHFRPLARSFVALCLAAAALAGCHRKPASAPAAAQPSGPLPFTGKLTEVEGVSGVVSFRHPKLINDDIEKLMAAVPESALARGFLAQFAQFGYPTFSEIAEGSNVGFAFLLPPVGARPGTAPTWVGFIKLKEAGKIGALLASMRQVQVKHGDWTLFAANQASIDKVSAPDSVIAFLTPPQREDVRLWVKFGSEMEQRLQKTISVGMARLPDSTAPGEEKAVADYARVLVGMLGQIHSAEETLTLTEKGLELNIHAQAFPDSALGRVLRYPLPQPAATWVKLPSGRAVADLAARQNREAANELVRWIFDALLAVHYPPGEAMLHRAEDAYRPILAASTGMVVGNYDLVLSPGSPQPMQVSTFVVTSGRFTPAMVSAYARSLSELAGNLSDAIQRWQHRFLPRPGARSGSQLGAISTSYHPNSLTVEGVSFDESSWVPPRMPNYPSAPSPKKQYFGCASGNLVLASSAAALKEYLPYVLGRQAAAQSIPLPSEGDIAARMDLNGAILMQRLADALGLNRKDPDVAAQFSSLSGAFAEAGPARSELEIAQANLTMKFHVPYKFIEASIHFGQYCAAEKADWTKLFLPRAAGPQRKQPARGVP